MISPAYVRAMAAYNAEMNRRVYDAAFRLSDAERRAERGAFWGSVHGTLCHLLWADRIWMSRLDGWDRPGVGMKQSPGLIEDFGELRAAREQADAALEEWAGRLDAAALAGDLVYVSGVARREVSLPRWLAITHLFNHQTHHRGQVHALLTGFGQDTGDTDLPFIIPRP